MNRYTIRLSIILDYFALYSSTGLMYLDIWPATAVLALSDWRLFKLLIILNDFRWLLDILYLQRPNRGRTVA